jgi:hypothetical protein
MGSGWPKVVGTPLSQLDPQSSGIAGPMLGKLTGLDQFPIYLGAAGLCFLVGKTFRPFYWLSALFAGLALYKVVRTVNGK